MTDRDATEVFSEWALRDRDLGMESGHAASVGEMLSMALSRIDGPFSAIDVGCGNGMMCVDLAREGFKDVTGVDYCKEAVDLAEKVAKQVEVNVQYKVGVLRSFGGFY